MSTLPQLKEQLSEKELRVYELELQVKDLKSEVTALYDAKDKLDIANRNARILEEENINLHDLVKNAAGEERYHESFPQGREALEVIKENDDLRRQLDAAKEDLKSYAEKSRSQEFTTDKKLRDVCAERDKLSLENERNGKELENYRRQCIDLRRALEEEQDTSKASATLWNQEKERYEQKINEILSNTKLRENLRAKEPLKQDRGEVPLQQVLLQEEVEELESKLHDLQEKQWQKEKEWIQTESSLRHTINELSTSKSLGGSDKEVFKVLQAQVVSLKDEIENLRGEKRATHAHAFEFVNDDTESVHPASEVEKFNKPATHASWSNKKQVDELLNDNARLQDAIDGLQNKILSLQLQNDEGAIQNKELEALLAAEKQKQVGGQRGAAGKNGLTKENSFSRESTASTKDDAPQLRQRIRVLQKDLNDAKASQDQKDALTGARIKEYQRQIEELLNENKDIRGDTIETVLADGSVVRLSKDKRDSVEDVMRLLEAAWQSEEEARRLLKKAQFQIAALANANAMKDEEIRRLQKALDDLEDRLRECYSTIDQLKSQLDDKDSVIRDLENRLKDLQNELDALARERDALKRDNKNLEKENAGLRRQLAELDNSRGLDGDKLAELNRLLDDLRDENDRLRRQLAAANAQRWSARRPSEGLSQLSIVSGDERRRSAVPEGAHLTVTVVELADVLRNGQPITEPGYIIIKLKSIKEKYKTTVKELSSVIRFDETFVFYLAQPDQDIITLHVFYKPKSGSKEFHIGDACFSMATLHRGVARQRIAPVAQNPGSKDARRAAQVEVNLQTDDFGKMTVPTEKEEEEERFRFNELVSKSEASAPEILHAVDVYLAKSELQ